MSDVSVIMGLHINWRFLNALSLTLWKFCTFQKKLVNSKATGTLIRMYVIPLFSYGLTMAEGVSMASLWGF